MLRWLSILVLVLAWTTAWAATLRFEAGPGPGFLVALQDHAVPGGRAGLGVYWRDGPGGALHLRYSTTWGPLGNVVADLDAAATGADWSVRVAARAVLGPLSLRLRAGSRTSDDLPLLRTPDGSFPLRFTATGEPRHDIEAGATYRVSRDLLVLLDLALSTSRGAHDLHHVVEVRSPRFAAGHELRLTVEAMHRLGPRPPAGSWNSAGIGLQVDRQRAPPWTVFLLLGGGERFAPGFRVTVAENLVRTTVRLEFRSEPWRSDVSGLAVALSSSGPFVGGSLQLRASVEGWPAGVSAGVSWSLPLE